MAQNYSLLETGVTTSSQQYGVNNNNNEALRSQFSGTSFPNNPTSGQACFRTDLNAAEGGTEYVYTGNTALGDNGWVQRAELGGLTQNLEGEIVSSRGTATTLDARLDVALNEDGTLKADAPAGSSWITEADAVTYVSSTRFTVVGDKTAIYTQHRAIRAEVGSVFTATYVATDATYASGTNITEVTLTSPVLGTPLNNIAFGFVVGASRQYLAENIPYNNTASQLAAETAQAAIDEIVPQLASDVIGDIKQWSFRAPDLPEKWYFTNGDTFPLTSPQGQALNGLSNNFKLDWGISITDNNINVPNMFESNGRGYFLRPVNGTLRQVGDLELSAAPEITGSHSFSPSLQPPSLVTGSFAAGAVNTAGDVLSQSQNGQTLTFSARRSSIVYGRGSTTEVRPSSLGVTPAIYLGV